MEKILVAVVATVAVGALVALQPPINSVLAGSIGSVQAAAVNFGVGFLLLAAVVAATGGFAEIASIGEVRWYYVVGGGAIGATVVLVVLITVTTLGATGVTAATVCGQLTASLLADRAGILGLSERGLTPGRLAGVGLLVVGVFLIVRD